MSGFCNLQQYNTYESRMWLDLTMYILDKVDLFFFGALYTVDDNLWDPHIHLWESN